MYSSQIKLGSFCENWSAAYLALSIKGASGLGARKRTESAGAEASCGGSGQGGRSGCESRFKMGGALEQGGAPCPCDCDCVAGGCADDPLDRKSGVEGK